MKIAKSSFCYLRVLKKITVSYTHVCLISSKNINCRFMIFCKKSLWFCQIWNTEKTEKILKLFIFATFGPNIKLKPPITIKFS